MKSLLDICYDPATGQALDVHLPDCKSFPVLLYFHGGALEGEDKSKPAVFFQYLTAQGIGVVSANYRLYPTARYPDFLTDAAKATAWVFENIPQYGEITGIYIGGSSAGGYLSQMLCFDRSWLAHHGIDPTDAAGFIHDAGQPTCHFNVLRERGIDPARVIVDDSAPLYHVGEAKEYPPMLVLVSDNDLPGRYEQTQLLIAALRQFGHGDKVHAKVLHGNHCAYLEAVDENGDSVFGRLVAEFIQR